MEKSFAWIAKKLGFSEFWQKIAGISGTIVATVLLLALAVYLFPSITSGILVIFAIAGMIGKSAEIYKLIKELINYIKEHQAKIKLA
jgi:di/tricarboxylate transporter